MSARHSFTVKDVCAGLHGVSRSRIHGWVQLPPFSAIPSQERSARHFSRADLLTFAVLRTLEDQFGARGAQLARVSAGIHAYLSTPQPAGMDECLFVPLAEGLARSIPGQVIAEAGWVINLARERIDRYLGVLPPQQELPLMGDLGRAGP